MPGFANLKTQSLISWVPEPLPKTNNIYRFRERWGSGGFPDSIGIKWNQKSRKIWQNNQFRPKMYPIFRFRPKFRLTNQLRHSRGRSQISNFGFRLSRNHIQMRDFGFGSGCFKSNFGCSLQLCLSESSPRFPVPHTLCVFLPPPKSFK